MACRAAEGLGSPMASIMPIISARVMSVMGRVPHRLTSLTLEQLPDGMAGSLPGQVPRNELLDHWRDGDRLALRLGGLQGAGALTRMNAAARSASASPAALRAADRLKDGYWPNTTRTGCGLPGSRRMTWNEITPRSVTRTPESAQAGIPQRVALAGRRRLERFAACDQSVVFSWIVPRRNSSGQRWGNGWGVSTDVSGYYLQCPVPRLIP